MFITTLSHRNVSDESTMKWFTNKPPPFGGNTAGECFDCMIGAYKRASAKTLIGDDLDTHRAIAFVGVFPMERFLSLCSLNQTVQLAMVNESGLAVATKRQTHWGYGELSNGLSRALSLHVTCPKILHDKRITSTSVAHAAAQFQTQQQMQIHFQITSTSLLMEKDEFLKSVNSWFI